MKKADAAPDEDYSKAEEKASSGERIEPVLVSAGPLDSLQKAYPNYFLDLNSFINEVEQIVNPSK